MEVKQHQETESNEAAQDDSISSLLRPDLGHEVVHTRDLTGRTNNAPINAGESFSLHAKVLVNCICLAEHTVHHIVAVLDPTAFLEHVFSLSGTGVRCAVCINVGAHIGEKVGAVACLGDCGVQPLELAAVVLKNFTVAGEITLFQSGRCEGSFGVKQAR